MSKMDRFFWSVVVLCAALVGVVVPVVASCQYRQPACTVIDLANEACKLVTIRYPDGHEEQVPKAEAVGAMKRAGLTR